MVGAIKGDVARAHVLADLPKLLELMPHRLEVTFGQRPLHLQPVVPSGLWPMNGTDSPLGESQHRGDIEQRLLGRGTQSGLHITGDQPLDALL